MRLYKSHKRPVPSPRGARTTCPAVLKPSIMLSARGLDSLRAAPSCSSRREVFAQAFRPSTRYTLGAARVPVRRVQLSPASTSLVAAPEADQTSSSPSPAEVSGPVAFKGVHHVALICSNLDRSLEFYQGVLGLNVNPDRPHHKLPYRGAWLWIATEMIHLMELPNPDPLDGRPEHGGRDRHFCIGVESVLPLMQRLDAAKVPYTKSMSGRPAIFFRDPDSNCLEVVETDAWRPGQEKPGSPGASPTP